MAWKTDWTVKVNGVDLSDEMRPLLTSITVIDKAEDSADSCSLEFDWQADNLRMPRKGSLVEVLLDQVPVFTGVVDKVTSKGGRSSGRVLSVSAKGFDAAGKAKEPQLFHMDDATIGDFMEELGRRAGFEVKVDPAFADIVREYQLADGESFFHVGQRLARELGGTFKPRGNKAILAKRGIDHGLPKIEGRFGGQTAAQGNLISWNISPITARPAFSKVAVRYFDRDAAEIKTVEADVERADERTNAVNLVRSMAEDKQQAETIADARKRESDRDEGEGQVVLDLYPEAQSEAQFTLSGTCPGVDGVYRIASAKHHATRSGGAITTLTLKQPEGGAGKDDRKSPDGSAGATTSGTTSSATTDNAAVTGGGSGELPTLDQPGDGPE